MKIRTFSAAALALLPFLPFLAAQSGLHYSAAEIAVWQNRLVNGPYKSIGDADANNIYTPGDWTRISNNISTTPSGDRWTNYYNGAGAVPLGTSSTIMAYEPKLKIDRLRDTAFYHLVTNDAAYLPGIKSEILWYVNNADLDFSNRTRYPVNSVQVADLNPIFFYFGGLTKILHAYDYVKAHFTPTERTVIEAWLYNAAEYGRLALDTRYDHWYSNHDDGVIQSSREAEAYGLSTTRFTHTGGYAQFKLGGWYTNRPGHVARFVGLAGVLLQNETFITRAKRFFKNWIRYAIVPDGTLFEMERGGTGSLQEQGLTYSFVTITQMLELADALARTGDLSLYNFSFTGAAPHPYPGGPKNLKLVLTAYTKYFNGGWDPARYWGTDLIDGKRTTDGRWVTMDSWGAQANIYYRDEFLKKAYLRDALAGFYPYNTLPVTDGSYQPWGGSFNTVPAKLFMFGQMEAVVWPYPSTPTDITTTALPSGRTAISYGNQQLAASGGSPPHTWALESGALPAGLSLSAAGVISGTPTTAETASFTVRATDVGGQTDAQALTITITTNSVPDITTTSLPAGTTGATYNQSITSTGGDAALVWSMASGALPAGLSLSNVNNQNATISGTPTTAGTANFTLQLADVDGDADTQALSIAVNPLPSPWLGQDIGAVGLTGSSTHASGTYTVKGSGTDIWGASDQFHFAHRTLDGDGEIVARVASIENTNVNAKAGVMIRETLNANSAHAFMNVTPGSGSQFIRRLTTGGSSSYTQGANVTAPYWVRLARSGSTFTGYTSADGIAWVSVGSVSIPMASSVKVGLAVLSRNNSVLNTSTFTDVMINLPSPWQRQDIGAVGVAGSSTYLSGTYTVKGSGTDIWGTSDQFQYAYQPMDGDGEIVARVATIESTNVNAKAGVMIRETLDASSAHAFMNVTPGSGLQFIRRLTTGGSSGYTQGTNVTAPYWVRLVRSGSTFTGYASVDGVAWVSVGSIDITMGSSVQVGLAVLSRNNTVLNTSSFSDVSVVP